MILLKIGFTEEIRTTRDDMKVLQILIFFPYVGVFRHAQFECLLVHANERTISLFALLIQQEILHSHFFLMSRSFETKGKQWCELKPIKCIFADKGIEGFATFLITLSSFLFFQ